LSADYGLQCAPTGIAAHKNHTVMQRNIHPFSRRKLITNRCSSFIIRLYKEEHTPSNSPRSGLRPPGHAHTQWTAMHSQPHLTFTQLHTKDHTHHLTHQGAGCALQGVRARNRQHRAHDPIQGLAQEARVRLRHCSTQNGRTQFEDVY